MADVVKLADHPMKLMMANKADKIHQLSRALKTTQVRAKRTEDGATVLAEHAQRLAKVRSLVSA